MQMIREHTRNVLYLRFNEGILTDEEVQSIQLLLSRIKSNQGVNQVANLFTKGTPSFAVNNLTLYQMNETIQDSRSIQFNSADTIKNNGDTTAMYSKLQIC